MDTIPENCYAAIDLGASSGRVLLGWFDQGMLKLQEVHRFDNLQQQLHGHHCWNIDGLFSEIVKGLALCKSKYGVVPKSIGIGTWGVDFVLLDKDDHMLGDAVAYRDSRTDGIYPVADAIMSASEVYARTGIQRQTFNTLYQLLALSKEHPEQLEQASTFLMIPDYLNFLLTGVKLNEYTDASTTGMLNVRTGDWDKDLISQFGIPTDIFQIPSMPSTVVGALTDDVASDVGYQTTVVLPATHDTGSAFLAVPARDEKAVFLSSGTWSLMGVENKEPITTEQARGLNFTNEGGYERRYRFLKNIMGLWMIQSIRRELNGVIYVQAGDEKALKIAPQHTYGFGELSEMARQSESFTSEVNVNDERFLSPDSMIDAVKSWCKEYDEAIPSTTGELLQVVYRSLAHTYAMTVDELKRTTGKEFTSINIVGGGCQDTYLDELASKACGMPVFAGPVEGTSLGNLEVQMIRAGEFKDLQEARDCVARSFSVKQIG